MQIEPKELSSHGTITIQWKNANVDFISAVALGPSEDDSWTYGRNFLPLDLFQYYVNEYINRTQYWPASNSTTQKEILIVDLTTNGDVTFKWTSTNRKLLNDIRSMESNISLITLSYILQKEIYSGRHKIFIKS